MKYREPPSDILRLDWNRIAHGLRNHGMVVPGTEMRTIPEYRIDMPVPCQVQFASVGSTVRLHGRRWRVKMARAQVLVFAGDEGAAYADWFAMRLAF